MICANDLIREFLEENGFKCANYAQYHPSVVYDSCYFLKIRVIDDPLIDDFEIVSFDPRRIYVYCNLNRPRMLDLMDPNFLDELLNIYFKQVKECSLLKNY